MNFIRIDLQNDIIFCLWPNVLLYAALYKIVLGEQFCKMYYKLAKHTYTCNE